MDFSNMTAGDWVGLTVGIIAIATAFATLIRYIARNALAQELEDIKHELKPNSGSSIKDQITRLEKNQADITKTQVEDAKRFDTKLDALEHKVNEMFSVIIKHFDK